MGFGNLGLSELLVLAALILVFFGPRKIPEVARALGGALREFHRGWNEIRRELEDIERDVSGDGTRRRDGSRRGRAGRVEPGGWGDDADEAPEEDEERAEADDTSDDTAGPEPGAEGPEPGGRAGG
ncbi:MAG: Sec-independent protein translocase subunit TatA/TatB [Gemmatimonadota bacterium]